LVDPGPWSPPCAPINQYKKKEYAKLEKNLADDATARLYDCRYGDNGLVETIPREVFMIGRGVVVCVDSERRIPHYS